MGAETSVIAGFDGSVGAEHALAWAADHAEAVHRPLRVCIARGDLYRVSRWADEWTAGLAQEWADQARRLLEVREADIEVEIADGNAAPVLIDRSTPESLVVVGSRGRGVFDAIPVGSVAQHVTRHAGGPVVVVRQTETPSSRRVVVGADDLPEGLPRLTGQPTSQLPEAWTCASCTPRIRPCPSPVPTPRGCLSASHCCGSGS